MRRPLGPGAPALGRPAGMTRDFAARERESSASNPHHPTNRPQRDQPLTKIAIAPIKRTENDPHNHPTSSRGRALGQRPKRRRGVVEREAQSMAGESCQPCRVWRRSAVDHRNDVTAGVGRAAGRFGRTGSPDRGRSPVRPPEASGRRGSNRAQAPHAFEKTITRSV
ncbi:hypothetical protein DBR10_15625 [Caulobacter sp. HMWF025]|nr:hypothetical protein DBR10_15625 [Caulobacter sp. HMWF025]